MEPVKDVICEGLLMKIRVEVNITTCSRRYCYYQLQYDSSNLFLAMKYEKLPDIDIHVEKECMET